jgi:hypothetical protein
MSNLNLLRAMKTYSLVSICRIDNDWHLVDQVHPLRSHKQNSIHELLFDGLNDVRVSSESLIGKPSENDVNLSSISLGSVGSEMNYFRSFY